MTTLSLDQLKSAFKSNENEGSSRPNNYYPFWDMAVGESAVVRFLPDKDPENPLGFLVEKFMHNLVINGEKKNVPCLKNYGEDCPICKVSSAFYREEDKVNGKKYWRKKQHLSQALIIEDPLDPNKDTGETHEGKVRFLALGYQLFNVIKETFESGELDDIPYAYENGCNFIIKKTQQGEYATYAVGSKFARKSSDLTKGEIAAVEDEMIELKTLLPAHPGTDKVESMLEAAMTGGDYVPEEKKDDSSAIKAAVKKDDVPVDGGVKVEAAEKASAETDDDEYDAETDEILAQIRGRKAAKE